MSLVEINKNQYRCHFGYGGLPALRSPVAPIAARIISSNAGERGPRANAGIEIDELKMKLEIHVLELELKTMWMELKFYNCCCITI